jgi:hypothetical protein
MSTSSSPPKPGSRLAVFFASLLLSTIICFVSFGFMIALLELPRPFGTTVSRICIILLTWAFSFLASYCAGRYVNDIDPRQPLISAVGFGGFPLLILAILLPLEPLSVRSVIDFMLPVCAFGATLAVGGYIGCNHRNRRKPPPQLGIGHTCANCNYNLSATPDHQPCPECGRMYRLSNTPPSAAHAEGP